jgi:hypothetical protein
MASITNFLNKIFKFKGSLGNVGNILHNQYVLYFFVIISVINLMFFASSGDIRSLLTLLIVGFLTSFFSKNMIVILFAAVVITHILKYGKSINEGMENQEESVTDSSGNSVPVSKESNDESENPNSKPEKKKGSKTSESMTDKKDDVTIKDLQGDLSGFTAIQDKLLGAMKEIDPLLTKAEAFIEKYEKYKLTKGAGMGGNDDE